MAISLHTIQWILFHCFCFVSFSFSFSFTHKCIKFHWKKKKNHVFVNRWHIHYARTFGSVSFCQFWINEKYPSLKKRGTHTVAFGWRYAVSAFFIYIPLELLLIRKFKSFVFSPLCHYQKSNRTHLFIATYIFSQTRVSTPYWYPCSVYIAPYVGIISTPTIKWYCNSKCIKIWWCLPMLMTDTAVHTLFNFALFHISPLPPLLTLSFWSI